MITADTPFPFRPDLGPDHSGRYASHAGSPGLAVVSPGFSASRLVESDLTWDPLLVCIAAFIWTSVGRVHQLFPVLGFFRPAVLTGALALVLYLVGGAAHNRSSRPLAPTTKFLIAIVVWMLLSTPFALSAGNSFRLLFDNFIKTVAMYFVIAGAVRGRRDVERLMLAYLLSATTYAAVVVARFNVGESDWRLGDLYYYDANDFAVLAVTAMPLGLYFLQAQRGGVRRWLGAFSLVVLTIAFVRSGSRGAFLAAFAVIGFILLRYGSIPFRWRVSATLLIAVVFLGAASDRYWHEMSTILSDADYNRTEETGRLQVWGRGIGYMIDSPVLGVGPDNFPTAEGTLSPLASRQQYGIGVRWSAAHNSFLQIGVELGIPGLIMFLGFIATALRALRWCGRNGTGHVGPGRAEPPIAPALTASLIGFVVGAFFLSLAYSEMLYTLVALAVGLQKVTSRTPSMVRRA